MWYQERSKKMVIPETFTAEYFWEIDWPKNRHSTFTKKVYKNQTYSISYTFKFKSPPIFFAELYYTSIYFKFRQSPGSSLKNIETTFSEALMNVSDLDEIEKLIQGSWSSIFCKQDQGIYYAYDLVFKTETLHYKETEFFDGCRQTQGFSKEETNLIYKIALNDDVISVTAKAKDTNNIIRILKVVELTKDYMVVFEDGNKFVSVYSKYSIPD